MKYLKIQNDGVLDIRLVALMGGTTKSNDSFKIGQFGTGLKYTLSFLLRTNLDFKIFLGDREAVITTETETINDTNFEIICIDGNRTSITTKMGEDWQAWMIVRELWCNALDEGGAVKDIVQECKPEQGKTIFYVQIDRQIQDVLNDWNKYFIHDQVVFYEDKEFALYPAGNHLCLYKQGVLIYENKQYKSLFSYDSKRADINELREFRGTVSKVISHAIMNASEKTVSYFLENITENHYEGQETLMDYNWFRSFGENWKKVIGSAKLIHKEALEQIRNMGNPINDHDFLIVPKVLYDALTKQFPGIGALYVSSTIGEFYESYSNKLEDRIKQALAILESCEYYIDQRLDFVYGIFGDRRVLARVSIKEAKIYVSHAMLARPLFDVVSMIIEENEHFLTGMSDNTREFQQHFIDLYAKELLKRNEVEI